MHGLTKIGIFCPLFCVNMLGKSTCIFVIYFTKGNFFGNLLHPFELKYRKFITKPTYPYNMCGIDLYILHVSTHTCFKNIFSQGAIMKIPMTTTKKNINTAAKSPFQICRLDFKSVWASSNEGSLSSQIPSGLKPTLPTTH